MSSAAGSSLRVLFVGRADNSHVEAWLRLFDGTEVDARLFALQSSGVPSEDLASFVYVSSREIGGNRHPNRSYLYSSHTLLAAWQRAVGDRVLGGGRERSIRWLAQVVRDWRPHIVQSLSLIWGGYIVLEAIEREPSAFERVPWVLQLWGGADLDVSEPEDVKRVQRALNRCDFVFDDSEQGVARAVEFGLEPRKVAAVGAIPGNGGIDLGELEPYITMPPSARTSVLWPKAYMSPWSRSYTVLDALVRAWEEYGPFRVDMLSTCDEMRRRADALPQHLRDLVAINGRIPRSEVLRRMGRARVMLAPSTVDGRPNAMFEAMALGALPIVSPLPTLTPIVQNARHVLFASNTSAQEISKALVRALGDDDLVDSAARENRGLVKQLVDRHAVRRRMVELYGAIAAHRSYGGNGAPTPSDR